ncbi:MAG: CRISPR-associated protein Cas4 [Bacteroidales bacterium]|nr:CRISPR-associated protein Cas4 [Bacteroidales bacterium]
MPYAEDDMLMLSGIQHYAFCPRQWALIHIDQQWGDNLLTTEGHIMHQHVDDPFYRQKMGDHICLRSVSLASKELGLYGISDMVELHPVDSPENAITHPQYPGHWMPYPVEYKHGKPKRDDVDVVQLAAQAMCLEEQYGIRIPEGAIFYGEIRRRTEVTFTDELRSAVRAYAAAMHEIFERGVVPSAEPKPYCRSCSLKDICMPETAQRSSASNYLKQHLYAETS